MFPFTLFQISVTSYGCFTAEKSSSCNLCGSGTLYYKGHIWTCFLSSFLKLYICPIFIHAFLYFEFKNCFLLDCFLSICLEFIWCILVVGIYP